MLSKAELQKVPGNFDFEVYSDSPSTGVMRRVVYEPKSPGSWLKKLIVCKGDDDDDDGIYFEIDDVYKKQVIDELTKLGLGWIGNQRQWADFSSNLVRKEKYLVKLREFLHTHTNLTEGETRIRD